MCRRIVKKEKVEGMTLVEALEKVVKPPKRNKKKAFRMPVSGVYKIKGMFFFLLFLKLAHSIIYDYFLVQVLVMLYVQTK